MKPLPRCTGSGTFPSLARQFLSLALVGLLILAPLGSRAAIAAPTANAGPPNAHVYLLRGALNVFSLGLDEIAGRLQAQGIPVTIANYLSWPSLADEAAADYKSGRVKTIILVGHSSGATALPEMVAKLGTLGVPVKLAIGLDSIFRTRLAGHAERYINFYVADGAGEPVTQSRDFRGKLENVDVHAVPGVGHITIDKNAIIQQRVISTIDALVFGPPKPPAGASQASAARQATGSIRRNP